MGDEDSGGKEGRKAGNRGGGKASKGEGERSRRLKNAPPAIRSAEKWSAS